MSSIFTDFPEYKKVLATISFARFGYNEGEFGAHFQFHNNVTDETFDWRVRISTDLVGLAIHANEILATLEMYAAILHMVDGVDQEDLLDVPVCLAINEDGVVCDWCILEEFL